MPGYIEVKSRKLIFNNKPESFPMPTVYVDTVSGWHKKESLPLAIIVISQETKQMLVIPTSSKDKWIKIDSFDRTRKIKDKWYAADKSLLKEYETFIEWLLARQTFVNKKENLK